MILSFRLGSTGADHPQYSIRVPFNLPSERQLEVRNEPHNFELQGYQGVVQAEPRQYSLSIRGLETETAAQTLLKKIFGALHWTGLTCMRGIRFPSIVTPVGFSPKPNAISAKWINAEQCSDAGWKEVDGEYESDKTTIIPEHKRLIMLALGSATVRQGVLPEIFAQTIGEAMAFPTIENVVADTKLRLACDVFASSHYEHSLRARFLTLITVLEILVPEQNISPGAEQVLDELIQDFKNMTGNILAGDPRYKEMQGIMSRLHHLKRRSIKSRIRELVSNNLGLDASVPDPDTTAAEIAELYDLRSTLVHTGELDEHQVGCAINILNDQTPRLLGILIRIAAGALKR